MEDIAPIIIDKIKNTFSIQMSANATIRKLKNKLEDGKASEQDAFLYARTVGNILQKAIKKNISADILPDGKMYYNIAERVVNKSFGMSYAEVSKYCQSTQEIKNKKNRIGVKAIKAEIDQDNIDNIIDKVVTYDNYDEASWLLETGSATFTKHIYDRNLKANADFHRRLGMKVVIVRVSDGESCPFCENLAGTYTKDNEDVYSRHNDCNCQIFTETR